MTLRYTTLLGMITSIVTGVAIGIAGFSHWRDQRPDVEIQLEELGRVMEHVQSSYVNEVTTEQLVSNALHGMLRGLDAHSSYLNPEEFDDLQAETSGNFGGIGIELGIVDDYFTVVSPIDNTPAARAGVKPGDRILEVDHESLKNSKLTDVVHALRGEPGTGVHLKLQRKNGDVFKLLNMELDRATIAVNSIRTEWLEPGYGYLRISQFQSDTGPDFHRALDRLKRDAREAATDLKGLVIDLRSNPGGLLQASVSVADALLDDGMIVYTEGRLPSSHLKYRAAGKDQLAGAPVIVLINGGSASASEIVAGALQDHARALLLGQKSFGKGSVQSVVPLEDDKAIKLTTAYYFTPNGRSIHERGIEPDILFEPKEGSDYESALKAKALSLLKSDGLQARVSP